MQDRNSKIRSLDVPKLIVFLRQNGPTKKRAEACWLLGKKRDKKAIPVLLSALQDAARGVRWEAAKALAAISHSSSIGPLILLMRNGKSTDIRQAAAYALSFMFSKRSPPAARALLGVLSDKREKAVVRAQAAEGLGNLQYQAAFKELVKALEDKNLEVRFWSIFALGKMGDSRAVPKLREMSQGDTGVLAKWGSIKKEARDAIKAIKHS